MPYINVKMLEGRTDDQKRRLVKAITDAIDARLKADGTRPTHVEGYDHAEWVLMDYFDFIVHVFTSDTRRFYDLERLWGSAARIELSASEARGSRPEDRGVEGGAWDATPH